MERSEKLKTIKNLEGFIMDKNKAKKTGPCGCNNPKLEYEKKEDFSGTTTILKCKNCGWGSVSTRR
jgi:hypothetical protein